jgi:Glycosyl transferase family 2
LSQGTIEHSPRRFDVREAELQTSMHAHVKRKFDFTLNTDLLARNQANKIAGICFIRDAIDIVPFLCGHYLRVGFHHLSFVDDGSSDGTFELLSKLSHRTKSVSVRQVSYATDRQPELMTDAANALIAAGYQIIVPFDADEFWSITAKKIDRMCSMETEVVFFGRWQNFVQDHNITCPRPFGLFHIKNRVPTIGDVNRESVTAFKRPFVCYSESKVAFKTGGQIQLSRGQHRLIKGPLRTIDTNLEIFHVPLRYRSEILKRALNYEPRQASRRTNPQDNWQSAFHAHVAMSGRIDDVWAANSARRDGTLNAYGEPVWLVPDNRLRMLLVCAWTYFMIRWPTVYMSALQNELSCSPRNDS